MYHIESIHSRIGVIILVNVLPVIVDGCIPIWVDLTGKVRESYNVKGMRGLTVLSYMVGCIYT